jgi:hypothetical protein
MENAVTLSGEAKPVLAKLPQLQEVIALARRAMYHQSMRYGKVILIKT